MDPVVTITLEQAAKTYIEYVVEAYNIELLRGNERFVSAFQIYWDITFHLEPPINENLLDDVEDDSKKAEWLESIANKACEAAGNSYKFIMMQTFVLSIDMREYAKDREARRLITMMQQHMLATMDIVWGMVDIREVQSIRNTDPRVFE